MSESSRMVSVRGIYLSIRKAASLDEVERLLKMRPTVDVKRAALARREELAESERDLERRIREWSEHEKIDRWGDTQEAGDSGIATDLAEFCSLPISREFRGIRDETESRRFAEIPTCVEILTLAGDGKDEAALAAISRAEDRLADFYFIHGWKILIHCRSGRHTDALRALLDGLRHSKRKSSLCSNYATGLFQNGGELAESIRWWIVSGRLQLETRAWTTHDPFLYLSVVADHLGNARGVAHDLLEISDEACHGDMRRLTNDASMEIARRLPELPWHDEFLIHELNQVRPLS